ncbi:DUF1206 domain-containing protein [Streptomyces sp. RFCAC02]|uniref:DUF1206 domain-containing protein n=1 Tax=Streptomyces sp. RFCAC02 TaxID=2499143 RepID=UPI0010227C22|nr:DUF1206 domain-containing protein [Streptomyces sp. RFCAC02]
MGTAIGVRGRATARRAADSTAVDVAARWGLLARGVVYLLIGMLALRIAFGSGEQQADQGGALRELSEKPFGSFLIWAVAIGLAGMAVWRLSEALFGAAGPDGRKAGKRLLSGARFVFYAFVAWSVLLFAAGEKGSGSSDRKSQDVTARALDLPAGQWLVAAAGIGIAVAGVVIAVRACRRSFRKHLRDAHLPRRVRRLTDILGIGGGVARGAAFAVAGVCAVRAAVDHAPGETKGLDDTLRTFADTPAGPALLVVIAVGLAMFGVFSIALARWRAV